MRNCRYFLMQCKEKGTRAFRWNTETGKVLQVVTEAGKLKKGRPNMVGAYYISEATLRGYLWFLKNGANGTFREVKNNVFQHHLRLAISRLYYSEFKPVYLPHSLNPIKKYS